MKFSTALSVSATALATVAIGYAFYFDYKRRNDPAFRKKLRKQSKQSVKAAKKEMKAAAQQENMMIEKAVKDVAEPGVLPTGVQEKEAFFMEQVATGEALFAQGPTYHVPAAIAFFKALKVYPAPVELVMIYQKAVPKEVFDLIMKLITRDAAVHGAGGASASKDDVDDSVPGAEAPKEVEEKPQETQEESKESKEEPKEPKEESKEPKEESKEESKEEPKEEPKEPQAEPK